jgi:DNA helicase HerA-like ATPase
MANEPSIFIGKGEGPVELLLKFGNRHGLIAGATGTGKTVTLQVLAEGFSAAGVPVFMADIKGDLSGISQPGEPSAKLSERATQIGMTYYTQKAFPVIFWDLYGQQGHPVRSTVSDMGPVLISRLLDLNDTQEGVMNIAFKLADDQGFLLLDFKDLRAILEYVSDNAADLRGEYGNVSPSSVGAIQRSLLILEQQGAEEFFGEPALLLTDLMRLAPDSRGYINILAGVRLMQSPRLYATFLLWLLSELFEELPEVGDVDKPKLVFFFDEAHLLFDTAPQSLIDKVEQVVRLIRSKGIGVYFITQNPLDVPDKILGQLGNRAQHALRAFTPRDQKAVRTAAETFRAREGLDTEQAIMQLGVGEALVSVLDTKGIPTPVERTMVRPPSSRLGQATFQERQAIMNASPVGATYNTPVDRESAFEKLKLKVDQDAKAAQAQADETARTKQAELDKKAQDKEAERLRKEQEKEETRAAKGSGRQGMVETFFKSAIRTIGYTVGREIIRGVLGSRSRGK